MANTRTGTKRSRRGCLTCKRRHTKCDEFWPECLNCVKSENVCVYATGLASVRTQSLCRRATGNAVTSTLYSDFELYEMLEQSTILACQGATMFSSKVPANLTVALRRAFEHILLDGTGGESVSVSTKCLKYALLAIGAKRLEDKGRRSSISSISRHDWLYHNSITRLPAASSDIIRALTSLILSWYVCHVGRWQEWGIHVDGAKAVMMQTDTSTVPVDLLKAVTHFMVRSKCGAGMVRALTAPTDMKLSLQFDAVLEQSACEENNTFVVLFDRLNSYDEKLAPWVKRLADDDLALARPTIESRIIWHAAVLSAYCRQIEIAPERWSMDMYLSIEPHIHGIITGINRGAETPGVLLGFPAIYPITVSYLASQDATIRSWCLSKLQTIQANMGAGIAKEAMKSLDLPCQD